MIENGQSARSVQADDGLRDAGEEGELLNTYLSISNGDVDGHKMIAFARTGEAQALVDRKCCAMGCAHDFIFVVVQEAVTQKGQRCEHMGTRIHITEDTLVISDQKHQKFFAAAIEDE